MDEYFTAALNLHSYLFENDWDGKTIVGPDPIGKIHWRLTRFIRSYFPWLPGDDKYVYLQGQAYWILGNLVLFDITNDAHYLAIVEQCADEIVARQPSDGAWRHPPIRGRKGFISTVEGVWASLGLMAAHKKTSNVLYLDSAIKWCSFQIDHIGYQKVDDGLAANYYAHSTSIVPNVATMLLWLFAEVYQITKDYQYIEYMDKMLHFIGHIQLNTGELPYELPSRTHFMCYQYNAFQFLDLANFYTLMKDDKAKIIMNRLAQYLSNGVTVQGSCRYNCFKENPEVNYWTAALATALYKASQLGLGQYKLLSELAYERVLSKQNSNGSFHFSDKNYYLLHDKRSYPRQQAMIMYFLLLRAREKQVTS
jgi:hypothetical protein